jgi:hypothetical protein
MRELHISIAYHPHDGTLLRTLFDLHYAKRPDANQNCIVCQVAPDVGDDEAVEKVRDYFLTERGRKTHEFELRLGHNERKEAPHREGEAELIITVDGVTLKPSVAA